mgnify:CR=1 FL=1
MSVGSATISGSTVVKVRVSVPRVYRFGESAWWMPRWMHRVLPHFDIEGEAVERELALAAWPEPGYAGPLAADGEHYEAPAAEMLARFDLA